MSHSVQMPGEAKAFLDVPKVIRFWPDAPVTGTPNYVVTHEGSTLVASTAGTAFGASTTVSSIASDRRTLTLGSDPTASLRGLMGEPGGPALLDDEDTFGKIPVKVQAVNGVTVTLADPLPHDVTVTAKTNLRLLGWMATLSTVAVTGTARRNALVQWTYVADLGEDYGEETVRFDHLLHVVPRPFAIGLTADRLFALVPGFGRIVPDRQESWRPQVAEAERWVVRQLRATSNTEDQYHGGEFDEVAARKTAAIILGGQWATGADRELQAAEYGKQAADMLNTVLARLQWFDSDDDGVPDAGESEVDQNMPDPTMVASLFDGADTDFDAGESPSFTRSEDSAFGRNH